MKPQTDSLLTLRQINDASSASKRLSRSAVSLTVVVTEAQFAMKNSWNCSNVASLSWTVCLGGNEVEENRSLLFALHKIVFPRSSTTDTQGWQSAPN